VREVDGPHFLGIKGSLSGPVVHRVVEISSGKSVWLTVVGMNVFAGSR
jgi:hypothetical protein